MDRTPWQLDSVKDVLHAMGDFHLRLKVIHIAGSKGKGSVAALTARILKEHGYRVGLYTSPHIQDIRERIRVLQNRDGPAARSQDIFPDMIPARAFARGVTQIQKTITSLPAGVRCSLSYFEVMTVLALYHFAREQADWVILETGLGGRKDATNVTQAWLSVITTITYEHTHILGKTLTRIAREKAGIIKRSTRHVVMASQSEAAARVIERRCARWGIPIVNIDRQVRAERISQNRQGQRLRVYYSGVDRSARRQGPQMVTLPLLGQHQVENLRVALGIMSVLQREGYSLSWAKIKKAIGTIDWPLRCEILQQRPWVMVDGAHTPVSARELTKTVRALFPQKEVICVFGMSADKPIEAFCEALAPLADSVYFTRYRGPRAAEVTDDFLARMFPAVPCENTATLRGALSSLQRTHGPGLAGKVAVITGSLYLAAEARSLIQKRGLGHGQKTKTIKEV